ncbi:cytosolic carboxypeptidase 2 [Gouania willdenowi]|uniref:cytosolic carboxypeptidase 2 n=1 Tax=Gouania willdenowi TaxID=441366 RepID=UPI0010556B58|nr:cytosolic carboxypeptidase 2-like [Gouania willdenowi]
MPLRDQRFTSTHSDNTSATVLSAIKNWWDTIQEDKLDTSDSNTDKEQEVSLSLSQTLRTKQLLVNFDGGRPVLSLREPLDPITVQLLSHPRWPAECEVISDVIQHIEWDPPEPEPFYQPTEHEKEPFPVGEERRTVVYCIDQAAKRLFFTCSHVGGNRKIRCATCPDNQTDLTLQFESRFESGNLQKAVQVGVYDYELTLQTDLYTRKHTQWFYFRVRNMKAGVTYRFTIINLMKRRSLYCVGMKPLLYSEKAAENNYIGWQRTGSCIRYYANGSQSTKDNSDTVALHSLSWTIQFPYDSDTCYLAHCYPYTYSHLQRYLRRISSNPKVSSFCKVRVLCHSLAGNAVYVLTITSPGAGRLVGKIKKAVVVTARVHPGETNGSWMMEGFMDFLLGDSDDAQLLRDTFVFKVVPMLNPDGVVVGNYRCSLAGRDLNRNYKTVLRDCFPCVWYTRKMVERLLTETDIVLYCDLHGHNRKNNVFMYGCNSREGASPKLHERVFPLMMSKNVCDKFSFKSCKFRVQKNKEGTGRIVMWRLGVKNSYTMEATFGGSTLGDRRGTHFSTRDLKSLGFYLCDTLLDYCDPDPAKITFCLKELSALLRKQLKKRLGKNVGTDSNISVSDLESSTSGSNSSDSDELPVHLLDQELTTEPQQNHVKKKKRPLKSARERNRVHLERGKKDRQSKEHPVTVKKPLNNLIRKAALSPLNAHSQEVSPVTLWHGYEPTQELSMKNLSSSYLHHRMGACLNESTSRGLSPHTDCRVNSSRQWTALVPSTTHYSQLNQQHHHRGRQCCTLCKVSPSLRSAQRSPLYVHLAPGMVSTKGLLSDINSVNFSGQCVLRNRNPLHITELYFIPEETKQMNDGDQKKTFSEGS